MPSSKGEFYDSLVGREYTVSSLMELHNVSRPTAYKWLKQQKIEPIANSWPPRYTLKTKRNVSATVESEVPKPKPEASTEEIAAYLEHLLKETTNIDIAHQFRKVKEPSEASRLVKSLEDVLTVARYYESYLIKDGLI